jgi:hypothetical protein
MTNRETQDYTPIDPDAARRKAAYRKLWKRLLAP